MNKKTIKLLSGILILIMFISFIMSIPWVATKTGEILKVPGQKIMNIARTVAGVSLGLYLISTGVAALAVPVIGIALIVVGVILVTWSVWPFFTNKKGE